MHASKRSDIFSMGWLYMLCTTLFKMNAHLYTNMQTMNRM